MQSITTTEPVKRIQVKISCCTACRTGQGMLDIRIITHATAFMGIPFLKTRSCKARLTCASCGASIHKSDWPETLKEQASQEIKQVPLTLWQRFGGWVVLAAVLVLAALLRRFV